MPHLNAERFKYSSDGKSVEIPVCDKYGYELVRMVIDSEDLQKILPYRWFVHYKGYIVRSDKHKGRDVSISYMILNVEQTPDILIDHKDGDVLNCRKSNLRVCTRTQNLANSFKSADASSKYKGVSWSKYRRKWEVSLSINRRRVLHRFFDNELKAAKAYNDAAIKYFGEFARLNVIEEVT